MVCTEFFFLRLLKGQFEFWACPHVFDQLDSLIRSTWFALSIFSHNENSCTRKFFEVIQLFLDDWIADCLVRWWKILAQGSWNCELVQLLLGFWIVDCFLRHIYYALWITFAQGSLNYEFVHISFINWIVLLGTHGLDCLFFLTLEKSCLEQLFWVMENSCLRLLEF